MRVLYPRIIQPEHAMEGLAQKLYEQVCCQQQYEAQVVARVALLPEALEGFIEAGVVGDFGFARGVGAGHGGGGPDWVGEE